MKLNITSKSPDTTKKIAMLLGKEIKHALVIALEGNLGAGKTTFVQGLAQGLGIKEKIKSPTFIVFNKYQIPRHKKLKYLYHFDLYRINNPLEIIDLGFEEIIYNKNAIVIIEWAEKIRKILPLNHLKIKINNLNKNTRKFNFYEIKV